MLDVILIAIAVGIVSRLAKGKGYSPLSFGVATAVLAFACGWLGSYFFGLIGDIVGILLGGVFMEEYTRNIPGKGKSEKQVFCPQCGLKQAWYENKLCEQCNSPLRK